MSAIVVVHVTRSQSTRYSKVVDRAVAIIFEVVRLKTVALFRCMAGHSCHNSSRLDASSFRPIGRQECDVTGRVQWLGRVEFRVRSTNRMRPVELRFASGGWDRVSAVIRTHPIPSQETTCAQFFFQPMRLLITSSVSASAKGPERFQPMVSCQQVYGLVPRLHYKIDVKQKCHICTSRFSCGS